MMIQIRDLSHFRFCLLFSFSQKFTACSYTILLMVWPPGLPTGLLISIWFKPGRRMINKYKLLWIPQLVGEVWQTLSIGGRRIVLSLSTFTWTCMLFFLCVCFLTGLAEPWCAQAAGWTLSLLMFFSIIRSSVWVCGLSGGLKVSDLSVLPPCNLLIFAEVFRFKMTYSQSWPIHKMQIAFCISKATVSGEFGAIHFCTPFFIASHWLSFSFSSGSLPQSAPRKANAVYYVRRVLPYPLRLCIHTSSVVSNEP